MTIIDQLPSQTHAAGSQTKAYSNSARNQPVRDRAADVINNSAAVNTNPAAKDRVSISDEARALEQVQAASRGDNDGKTRNDERANNKPDRVLQQQNNSNPSNKAIAQYQASQQLRNNSIDTLV